MTNSEKRGRDNGEQSDSDSDSNSISDHENGRGRTVLTEVRKAIQNGVKIPLDWNAAKLPSGEHRITFATYIGVIARERVSINYARWKDVPAELLDEVYTDIAKGFTVLPDRRGWILSRASERWRCFKSLLVRCYLYKKSGKIRKKAPSTYPFILQSDWEKFISYCTSDDFKERSEKNSARGKMRISKYRGGRLGYQYYQEEIAKELEAQGIHVEKVPRHLSWLKAHKNKADGSYAPCDLEIAEAIKTLDAQAQKGEIAAEGRDDILAKVLKKPEHGGRVRGVGYGITNKEYFGPEPKASQVHNEVKSLQCELAQLTSKQNFMMAFLMEWSQQSTNQASPFTPEQIKQKMSQFMSGSSGFGSGQSSGFDGKMGGLGDQSEDAQPFVGIGPSETVYQSTTVSKSLISSEPDRYHHLEPDMDHDSETETDYDSDPEIGDCIPIDCDQGNCTPIDYEQASHEYLVGIPPTYSGADIGKARDLWIDYVFQPKQGNKVQD